ncbi:MAG: hypothetical protein KatS3mg124_0029 [Porticoccaceae bacterium]|nr:MAG: hypothetical protein KatS3mg124_0029 [Porticoccaceae bacterium]
MNWADWVILAILAFSTLLSAVRGFVREALSLAVWAAAVLGAAAFHRELAGTFAGIAPTPSLQALLAWVAIFLAVLMAGSLLVFLLGKLVEGSGLSGTDRLLGAVFGAARGFLVVMAILIVLPAVLPVSQDPWWRESRLIPHFLAFEERVMALGQALFDWLRGR